MKPISICVVLMVCLGCPLFAQTGSNNAAAQNLPGTNVSNGKSLPVNLNVGEKVRAQAVLIPRVDVNRIFGKEIAENYAVIQLVVGNKSNEAALIIHGIYIDYSKWALSGTLPPVGVDGLDQGIDKQFQAQTSPNHIASEEYRVVRGQLLDAQTWSKRNWTVRLLTLAGSLAGAYSFSIKEKGFLKGIAAFNGVFVPGVADAWPDGTVAQINRVSDFGYQANKVIPQQGSDILVCFFPIDRFLSPGFRRLFLKSPSLFFAPLQMLLDKTIEREVEAVLGQEFGLGQFSDGKSKVVELRKLMPCYLSLSQPQQNSEGAAAISDTVCLEKFGLERDAKGKLIEAWS